MVRFKIPEPLEPETVLSLLKENGQMRLSEVREELEHDHHLGDTLLDLVERGEVRIFPVGNVVLVKPE